MIDPMNGDSPNFVFAHHRSTFFFRNHTYLVRKHVIPIAMVTVVMSFMELVKVFIW